jgi:hypothetical protein
MSNGVRYTPTFAMPTEYERAAMEARRRQRMAEMLAQQAYTPQDIGSAPIPRAAPLVQGLQSFLLARQLKKAEEAEGAARSADIKSAIEEMQRINRPSETVEFGDIPSMRPEDQERVKALTGQASVTGPEFNISPTGEVTGFQPMQMGEVPDLQPYLPTMTADQKRLAYAQMLGGGPVSQLLGTQGLAKLDKSVEEEFGTTPVRGASGKYYLPSKSGRLVETDVEFPKDDSTKPLLTPAQLADLRLKYGTAAVDRALGVSGLSPDVQSSIPNLPTFESLIAPLPANMPGARGADLETGEFTPERGLQYRGQATTATGAPVSGEQKPMIERVSPKAYGEMVAKQPNDKKSTQSALGQISMMRNLIQDLQNHGGLDYIFGPIQSITPDWRGSATSARSLFDTLREQVSVEALKQSRAEGFSPGSMTVQEWPKFETAIGPIRAAKDPRAMRRALENADAQLRAMESRVLTDYQDTYGPKFPLEWSPAPYKPESSLYPTPKVKAEDQAVFDKADRLIMEMQQRRAPRGK